MKKMQKYLLASLVLAGSILAVPARAQEADTAIPASEDVVADEMIVVNPPEIAFRPDGAECRAGMSLSDEQLEKMAALKDQYMLNTAGKKAELKALFHQMGSLLSQPAIDRQKISAVHERMTALKNDLSNARLAYIMDKAEVLTPEQRKALHHKMLMHQVIGHGRWHHHFGGCCGHGHGHGPGPGAKPGPGPGPGRGA
jgi:Spy/CpxP family protein refolding chaperone